MSKPVPVALCPMCDCLGWQFDIDQAGMCIECIRATAARLVVDDDAPLYPGDNP